MRRQIPRTGRAEVTVDAPVESVWGVVSDVTRTGEWSHECRRLEWLGGATAAAPGVRFRGANRSGPWRWSRACEVVDVDAPHRIAWRTIPTWRYFDSTDWVITLEPDGERTTIVQTYEVTYAARWWAWLTARLVPAHLDRTASLTADLVRIGEVAAYPAPPPVDPERPPRAR